MNTVLALWLLIAVAGAAVGVIVDLLKKVRR